MKIFITGGTGFIGSRVTKELKKRNHTLHLLSARLANLRAVERELKKFKPDCVIHLAWEGLPDYGAQMSAKNLADSTGFLALLARLGIKKVVATGSCFEYDTDESSGHWPCVVAKRALREIGKTLMRQSGGTFVWTVPFFVYGSGKPKKSLIPALIAQARRGEVPVAKNADAWHDFVYVDDVAHGIVLLTIKRVPSGVYDLGRGALTRTGDIAATVARVYGLPPEPLRHIRKKGLQANVRMVQKALGWKPRTTLRQGIKAMVQEEHAKRV